MLPKWNLWRYPGVVAAVVDVDDGLVDPVVADEDVLIVVADLEWPQLQLVLGSLFGGDIPD